MDAFITIARIVKTRGIKGELSAELHTDFPERFEQVGKVRLILGENTYWEELESYWFHKDRVILKLAGRNRPHESQPLVGCEVQVAEEEAVALPEDCYFQHQLVGCEIFDRGQLAGEVTRVLEVGSSGLNLVIENEKGEWMLPWVRQFITRVDVEHSRIDAVLPSGLVETTVQPGKQ